MSLIISRRRCAMNCSSDAHLAPTRFRSWDVHVLVHVLYVVLHVAETDVTSRCQVTVVSQDMAMFLHEDDLSAIVERTLYSEIIRLWFGLCFVFFSVNGPVSVVPLVSIHFKYSRNQEYIDERAVWSNISCVLWCLNFYLIDVSCNDANDWPTYAPGMTSRGQ